MKGIQGLAVAIVLGIVGASLNWAYLYSRSKDFVTEAFIVVKPDVTVERGERLSEDHLEPLYVPLQAVPSFDRFAVRYADRRTVTGMSVWRTLRGGYLLLQDDLKTAPHELNFGKRSPTGTEERAVGIPVDTKSFVPSLVNPGDMISFVASRGRAGGPTLAPPRPETGGPPKPQPGPGSADDGLDIIGPFKVLSLGNRLGSSEVMRAAKIPQTQENVMTVLVRIDGGKLEQQAARLLKLVETTNSRPLAILLHPRPATK